MFTLAGALIGFTAMLVARGRAGVAAGLAMLGVLLGVGGSFVFFTEQVQSNIQNLEALQNVDWSMSNWIAGGLAAAPGVLGAIFARRD